MKKSNQPSPLSSSFPRNCGGFTLMEVMLATLVLAMAVSSSLIGVRTGFGMVEVARDQTIASQFLQSEVETLRLHNWKELMALPQKASVTIESEFDQTVQERFACTRTIEAFHGLDMRRVVLSATWTSSAGIERELVYQTIIAKDGINDYYYRSM